MSLLYDPGRYQTIWKVDNPTYGELKKLLKQPGEVFVQALQAEDFLWLPVTKKYLKDNFNDDIRTAWTVTYTKDILGDCTFWLEPYFG